jgi:hypothetical protein
MKFFSFDEIRERGDCVAFAREHYGCKINGTGRCAALWRGGDDPENVSIEKTKFFDHVAKQGGGIIELAAFKFGGNKQAAQEFLGNLYGLTPKMETGPAPGHESRYDQLIREGYEQVALYQYRTHPEGRLVHFVARLQRTGQPGKEFCQGIPDEHGNPKWGLHGTATILYRLDAINDSQLVCIVEGEKSCDRMNAIGLPSTTCCGGAKKWRDELSLPLRGKDVAIFPDNDEPGREHAEAVAASVLAVAASVKIIPPAPGLTAKQGIDDWIDAGHTADEVIQLIAAAPPYVPPADLLTACMTDTGPTAAMLAEAKRANSIPFRNFIPSEKVTTKRGREIKEITKEPRTHRAMIDDINKRFLGFPRKVGSVALFDHDRDTGEIIEIDRPVQFKSWIGRRSKHNAEFARGDNLVTETELFESVVVEAHRYESISLIPDWPRREEVYYAHEKIPTATPDHRFLEAFVDFFIPATHYDRILIKAMVCAPLWYIPGVARPAWVIDSKDGQGSGKSKLAMMVSQLYGAPPITVCRSDLERDQKEIRKRCVSRSGRNARIFLVDNVVGSFQSPELASLISFDHISGLAPYGHGEESRENNLVFCITTNSATVDTDIADRSLYIYLCHPNAEQCDGWDGRIKRFINDHRLNVVADIIDMISKHQPFDMRTRTRFSEFEKRILQPCCGSPETVKGVLDHVFSIRAESNIEEEFAKALIDGFNFNIERLDPQLNGAAVFIHSQVVNSWGGLALAELRSKRSEEMPVQIIHNLAKKRMLPMVDSSIRQWPTSSRRQRYRGIAWNFTESTESAPVITFGPDKSVIVKYMIGGEV